MTPAERTRACYHKQPHDYVPFVIYETKVVGRPYEAQLRAMDICLLRRVSSYRVETDDSVQSVKTRLKVSGQDAVRTVTHTPYGDLTETCVVTPITQWTTEHAFKDEQDYDRLAYLWAHQRVVADHEAVYPDWLEDQKNGNVITRTQVAIEPLQQLISYTMGTEAFCYEWMDNREQVLRLVDILREQTRAAYPIVAESPFELVNYGGNAAPEIVGREGFQAFYMREHREAAEVISPAGKLLGSHMDGCNAPIMDLIGEDALDYIEAYDPVMSPGVGEAQRALGDRVLSLHFPSAWQTHSEEQVVRDTIGLIEDAADPQRLIIGITEDMDMDRYVPVIRGIMRGIRAYGRIG